MHSYSKYQVAKTRPGHVIVTRLAASTITAIEFMSPISKIISVHITDTCSIAYVVSFRQVRQFLFGSALSIPNRPAHFVGLACINFLEGIKRPVPGMVMMIGANVVNIGVNWLLISGHLGFPALGAAGAITGTVLARYGVTIMALVYIFRMRG